MAKNTTTEKPAKPTPDFPLFAHQSGRWAKKVRAMKGLPGGEMRYFGPWSDPQGALALWEAEKEDLLAGRMPRARGEAGPLVLGDLANRFITAMDLRVGSGDLSQVSRDQYFKAMEWAVSHFGRNRLVSDISAEDWGQFRAEMAKRRGPVALAVEIQRIRTAFNWAFQAGVIDTQMRFGLDFKKPKRKELRKERLNKAPRYLDREQILKLIDAAATGGEKNHPSPELKAAILLGINCGWGNGDIAGLNLSHIDLANGVADYPRPKTSVERRCFLWAETVEALKVVLKRREKLLTPAKAGDGRGVDPCTVADADRDAVVLTKYRQRYVIPGKVDSIGLAFGRLLRRLEMKLEGVNFYALRHVFETVAEGAKDTPAVHRIMGHADESISNNYREWNKGELENQRLRAVADHVHAWLYGKAETPAEVAG